MKDSMKDIVKILEEQVINKTLNLEGITQVQKILEENKSLTAKNKTFEETTTKLHNTESELRKKLANIQGELSDANTHLEDYRAKDKEFYEQSVKFKYEQKRGDELKEVVHMALRNPIITESRFNSSNDLYPNRDGVIQSTNGNSTVTKEVT